MTAPITAARTGGLSFRLGGIPVTIHLSFLLVIGLLGLGLGPLDRLLVWVVVATVAVLLHELGHAVVGRLAGLTPRIDLAGFGGVTSWSRSDASRRSEQRGWSLAISVAGPGIGFLGGGFALLLGAPCCTAPPGTDLPTFAAAVWLFASFGWGILNLLPILPLDGGQALRAILPGAPLQRLRRAAAVGVLFGVALTGWALVTRQTFLALLAGWITWSNVQQFQAAGRAATGAGSSLVEAHEAHARGELDTARDRAIEAVRGATDDPSRRVALVILLDSLLRTGRSNQAWAILRDPRLDVAFAPHELGSLLATHPEADRIDDVVRRWLERSDDPATRGTAAIVLVRHGHGDEAADLLRRGRVDAPVAVEVQERLHASGAHRVAAHLGAYLAEQAPEPIQDPRLAYNTACSFARDGDPDAAVRFLRLARQRGFADDAHLQEDEDLAVLRQHPAWEEVSRRS